MQLRDRANNTIAQADHPLHVAQNMLTADGQTLRDGTTLALPPDMPTGSYQILVGFYDPETLDRLAVINDQSGENAAILTEFEIE